MKRFKLIFDSLADLAKDKSQLLMENTFLRQQPIVLKRSVKKVKSHNSDRIFFVFFKKVLANWKDCLYIIKPDTVIGWHRSLARSFWRWYSKTKARRNAKIPQETVELVCHMAMKNKRWSAERIQGEIFKLGFKLSIPTIAKIIRPFRKHAPEGSQSWTTFIENHAGQIWAADFFTVTTAAFKQIYVFVIMAVKTREILHWAVTGHPDAEWTKRQILQSTWDHKNPKFLIVDRDSKYGGSFNQELRKKLSMRVLRTPYRSPKANSFCERLIGTMRRECLDHFIIFGEKHLRKILTEYIAYYNERRPHQGLGQRIPCSMSVEPEVKTGAICSRPVLGGLIQDFYRKAS